MTTPTPGPVADYRRGYDDGRYDECRTWARLSLPGVLACWWEARRDPRYRRPPLRHYAPNTEPST